MSPDITMCAGKENAEKTCPLREQCHRYKATPSEWQSWFVVIPYDFETQTCRDFWPVT
jgi:hypothetical protein